MIDVALVLGNSLHGCCCKTISPLCWRKFQIWGDFTPISENNQCSYAAQSLIHLWDTLLNAWRWFSSKEFRSRMLLYPCFPHLMAKIWDLGRFYPHLREQPLQLRIQRFDIFLEHPLECLASLLFHGIPSMDAVVSLFPSAGENLRFGGILPPSQRITTAATHPGVWYILGIHS